MYFDSHAHLDDAHFDGDRAAILDDLKNHGVTMVMNVGCDLPSSERSVRLAEQYPFLYAAVGSHPDDADHVDGALLARYRALCASPRVRAIGEIGLDYHYEDVPRTQQRVAFEKQLALAEELAGLMERFGGVRPPVETLDITLYRDDLSELGDLPEVRPTQFSTPVAGKTVILVDDVIYTGRTARAAMEAVIRLGRPARIRLAVMVDRGHRELPIDPEYVGKNVPTAREEQICVLTPQFDGQWGIHLRKQA